MLHLYHRAFKLYHKTNNLGLIQHLHRNNPNLYYLNWSTLTNEGVITDDCILNSNTFCISEGKENSSMSVIFPNSLLKITGLSLMSAKAGRYVINFDVYGLLPYSDKWTKICHVAKEDGFFHGVTQYVDCQSQKYMTAIKLMQVGLNGQQTYEFAIRYLDFFGDLVMGDPSVITFCMKMSIHFHHILIALFILK